MLSNKFILILGVGLDARSTNTYLPLQFVRKQLNQSRRNFNLGSSAPAGFIGLADAIIVTVAKGTFAFIDHCVSSQSTFQGVRGSYPPSFAVTSISSFIASS